MREQQQTLRKFFSAEGRRGLKTQRVTRSLSTLNPPKFSFPILPPWPPPPFEMKLPCPGQPGSGGRVPARLSSPRRGCPERRQACGALRRGRPRCLPPGAAAADGAEGRRTGLIYLRSQSPGGAASRGCCGSRCAPAARSALAGSRPPSKTHTHTAGHRAAPRIGRRGDGDGGVGVLRRVRAACRVRLGEARGKKNHPLPTSAPQAAGARPAAPACAPAGVARPPLNCATARHGSGLPGNRAPCPPGGRRFSPSPPSPAAGNPPAQPPAEVCPSGRKVHSGAGLPRAGRGVPRGSCIPPAAPGAQRPRSQKLTAPPRSAQHRARTPGGHL